MVTDNAIAIAAIATTLGLATVVQYATIIWCPPPSTMDSATVWGYLVDTKRLFMFMGTATAVAVLWWYISLIANESPDTTAVIATVLFFVGAATWPIGVLLNVWEVTVAGVVVTAVGSVLVMVTTIENGYSVAMHVAAAIMVWQHCVIDGLWAALTARGAAYTAEGMSHLLL